jgi:hypothetical protein
MWTGLIVTPRYIGEVSSAPRDSATPDDPDYVVRLIRATASLGRGLAWSDDYSIFTV